MLNIGLYHGLSGRLLIDSLLNAEGSVNKISLLHTISENIGNLTDYSFNRGILGIAWALEWLTQNHFLNIDSNEILEEVDDNAYKIAIHIISKKSKSINEILDVISYLHVRIAKVSSKDFYYRFFPLVECLKLLVEELCLTAPRIIRSVNDLTIAATVLLRLSYLVKVSIPEKKVDDYVYQTVESVINFLFGSDFDSDYKEGFMKLSLFAIQFENLQWRELFTNALFNIKNNDIIIYKNFDDIFVTDIIDRGQKCFRLYHLKDWLINGISIETLCFILTNIEIKPIVNIANQ